MSIDKIRLCTRGVLLLILYFEEAIAYEVPVHEAVTETAVENSILSNAGFLIEIGVVSPSEKNSIAVGNRLYSSSPNGYDRTLAFIPEVVKHGVADEDSDTPYIRPANHFFDPQNNGMRYPYSPLVTNFPSPEWILEPIIPIDLVMVPWIQSGQDYSLRDALNYFHSGLTSLERSVRELAWGDMFLSTGHIVHHIQDMGQPQHTRSDNHCSSWVCKYKDLYAPSVYEFYSDSEQKVVELLKPGNSYPDIDLNDYLYPIEFWENSNENGFAEYSSNNFVGADTNFQRNNTSSGYVISEHDPIATPLGDVTHSLPSAAGIVRTDSTLFDSVGRGHITFLGTYVKDNYHPSLSGQNERTSSDSIFFDKSYESYIKPTTRQIALNGYNYDEMMKRLIPRALSYSVAMIDFIFRGRLEINDIEFSNKGVGTLNVKNISGEGEAFIFKDGLFELFIESVDGKRKKVYLSNAEVSSLYDDEEQQLSFDLNLDENGNALSDEYRYGGKLALVYDGIIGKTRGVTGYVFKRPALASYKLPGYAEGLGQRKIAFEKEYVQLYDTTVQAGAIDWKGAYEKMGSEKVATKSLSFKGPRARYFGRAEYEAWIYKKGVKYFRAPASVTGAALTNDSQGQEWVIAVVVDPDLKSETVYKKRSDLGADLSPMLFNTDDPELYPNGWVSLGNFKLNGDENVYTPWFFNGDGTEARAMRREEEVMYFTENHEDPNGVAVDENDNPVAPSIVAGDYEVTVLTQYKLSVDATKATRKKLGFEVGNTTTIAADYLDNEVLLLQSSNPDPLHPDRGSSNSGEQVPAEDGHVLEIVKEADSSSNGGEVILGYDETLCAMYFDKACRQWHGVALGNNWDGFIAGSIHREEPGSKDLEYRAIHITYLDLRTSTMEYSTFTGDFDLGEKMTDGRVLSKTGKAEYWMKHADDSPKLLLEINDAEYAQVEGGYSMSYYGAEAAFRNQSPVYLPVLLGQYANFGTKFSVAPLITEQGRVVTRDNKILATGKGVDGASYNYFSGLQGGDLASFSDTNLSEKSVVDIGLR